MFTNASCSDSITEREIIQIKNNNYSIYRNVRQQKGWF